SWRVLWLLNLPTGALILLLNRWIPESPRFLSNAGLEDRARAGLRRFSGHPGAVVVDDARHPGVPGIDERRAVAGVRQLMRGRHAPVTVALLTCGLAWGMASFGFILWLPVNLVDLGVDPAAVIALLTRSALLALPGIALVVWLYHRWSSFRALALVIGLSALALLVFWAMTVAGVRA